MKNISWSQIERLKISKSAVFYKTIHKFTLLHITDQFSSVHSLSHIQLFVTLGLHHARPPCPSPTPGVYSNSCALGQWCHPTISSSIVPFSSHLQSFPASGSFQMSQFFTSGSQSTGVSALASVLPMNIQDWFPLGWTAWISLQSKGLSRVFSNTTVQKRQFLGTQSFPCLPPGDPPTHRWYACLLCPLHWWEDSFSLVQPGKLQLYINL